ncbi:PhzF family phenazine biosynthesis protein [Ilyobacter polytropus]|uniref:Phenazine biosynthesis protein PhzF family n=1 Tax=Ilyobacter polytropus (strain ATCC 51220 / DSM 2926 / LMG 16218 / CuHBu1) TaxID=572544 RepID=E3H801_ILYPC|nr:PhzF family phenazine biosynthesis protein [Ilyobacter polytropus]ADO82953.1 phenazine biosynthesis protein PhzF family [Ilyobacter polytropus DSM 2926]
MSLKIKALKIYQVDAFTDKAFHGNSAGVCILEEPIEDEIMQAIAAEMNLSETAFLIPEKNSLLESSNVFSLRWFTPKVEVSMCGHATLAASAILFDEFHVQTDEIIYRTKSGKLIARKKENKIVLDFPLDTPVFEGFPINKKLLEAVGISEYENIFLGENTKKLVVHLKNHEEVLKLNPNFELMRQLDVMGIKGLGVTASIGADYDFISRYFNPWAGIDEDSVTGSVHTLLASYWSEILGKNVLNAYQASKRGGEMLLKLREDRRLEIIGDFIITLKGEIYI